MYHIDDIKNEENVSYRWYKELKIYHYTGIKKIRYISVRWY